MYDSWMELEVLGIGNAFTSRYHQTSFLIRANRNYLVNGPQGLLRLLRERMISREEIDDVIVTHAHGDHVAGLETLLLWKRSYEKKRVRLYTSAAVFNELEKGFFYPFSKGFSSDLQEIVTKSFEDYVDFQELCEGRQNELENGLTLDIRHNWHPTPTLGLKFVSREGSIAISGDTCYRPTLLRQLRSRDLLTETRFQQLAGDWLWSADVVYHEADHIPDGPHTYLRDLLELPDVVREKLRLVHVPDDFQTDELSIAREGERIAITRSEGIRLIDPVSR